MSGSLELSRRNGLLLLGATLAANALPSAPAGAQEKVKPGETDVLIVVDVQNDFLPGGALAVTSGDAVIAPINALGKKFAHIVLTQDWHTPGHISFASSHAGRKPFEMAKVAYGDQVLWPDHCVQGTRGAALADGLDLPKAELIIRKGFHQDVDSYSAFIEGDQKTPTGLAGYLRARPSPSSRRNNRWRGRRRRRASSRAQGRLRRRRHRGCEPRHRSQRLPRCRMEGDGGGGRDTRHDGGVRVSVTA